MAEQFQLNDDRVWRHIAVVYDETTDTQRLYYDGKPCRSLLYRCRSLLHHGRAAPVLCRYVCLFECAILSKFVGLFCQDVGLFK